MHVYLPNAIFPSGISHETSFISIFLYPNATKDD